MTTLDNHMIAMTVSCGCSKSRKVRSHLNITLSVSVFCTGNVSYASNPLSSSDTLRYDHQRPSRVDRDYWVSQRLNQGLS